MGGKAVSHTWTSSLRCLGFRKLRPQEPSALFNGVSQGLAPPLRFLDSLIPNDRLELTQGGESVVLALENGVGEGSD